MARSAIGVSVTDVDTEAKAPLGHILELPAQSVGSRAGQGPQKWVYVFNDEASTAFAVGDVVIRDPSATTEKMFGAVQAPSSTPAPAVSVLGVVQHAIPAGSYGFVLAKGQGLFRNGSAGITADTPLTSGASAAGGVIDFAGGVEECVIGFSLEAEASASTTFNGFINCPGSGA